MKKRLTTIYFVLNLLLVAFWIVYGINSYNLFAEVKELTTPGTSYMIKLLEFTNYRGEELSTVFIVFFIFLSISNITNFYVYNKISLETKNKFLAVEIVLNVFIVGSLCIISNIFWSIYLGLFLLSSLIVAASFYVSIIFWGTKVTFNKGDIIYRSDAYDNENIAKNTLNEKLREIDTNEVSSDTFQLDDEYYFEIYAESKLIFDNKGEVLVYEEEE